MREPCCHRSLGPRESSPPPTWLRDPQAGPTRAAEAEATARGDLCCHPAASRGSTDTPKATARPTPTTGWGPGARGPASKSREPSLEAHPGPGLCTPEAQPEGSCGPRGVSSVLGKQEATVPGPLWSRPQDGAILSLPGEPLLPTHPSLDSYTCVPATLSPGLRSGGSGPLPPHLWEHIPSHICSGVTHGRPPQL